MPMIEVAPMALFSIVWVLLLIALLHWWAPDAEYSNEPAQRILYHGAWLLMASLLVYVHYQLMTKARHQALAMLLDVGALALFGFLQLFRARLRRQVQ